MHTPDDAQAKSLLLDLARQRGLEVDEDMPLDKLIELVALDEPDMGGPDTAEEALDALNGVLSALGVVRHQ